MSKRKDKIELEIEKKKADEVLKTLEPDTGKTEDEQSEAPVTITAPKEPDLPLVPLVVFCNVSGKKPDQIAGFRRYALNKKFDPMTIPQWREKLVEFERKPTL